MTRIFSLFSFSFVLVASFFVFAPLASAQTEFSAADIAAAPSCQRFPSGAEGYLCSCDAGFTNGSVWGSGPFTGDSNICTAAQFSGVISADGGPVFARGTGAQEKFTGSSSFDVQTSNWGSYGSSFIVEAALPSSFAEACSTLPNGVDQQVCSCGENTGSAGSVWGSGPYTADSNICAAARHAGFLDDGPGIVSVLRIQGLSSYAGSEWNGITSSNWGNYSSSIVFDGN